MAKRPSHHVGWHSTTAGGGAERGLVEIVYGVQAVTLTCTSHVEIIRLKLDQGAVERERVARIALDRNGSRSTASASCGELVRLRYEQRQAAMSRSNRC